MQLKKTLNNGLNIVSGLSLSALVAAAVFPDKAIELLSPNPEEVHSIRGEFQSNLQVIISQADQNNIAVYFDENLTPVGTFDYPVDQNRTNIDLWHDQNRTALSTATSIDLERDIPYVIVSGRGYFPDLTIENIGSTNRVEQFSVSFLESFEKTKIYDYLYSLDPSRIHLIVEAIDKAFKYGYITFKSKWENTDSETTGLLRFSNSRNINLNPNDFAQAGQILAHNLNQEFLNNKQYIEGIIAKFQIENSEEFIIAVMMSAVSDPETTTNMLAWGLDNLQLSSHTLGYDAFYELSRQYFVYTNNSPIQENFTFQDAILPFRIMEIAEDFENRLENSSN